MLYVRFRLSLRNVEDLAFERDIDRNALGSGQKISRGRLGQ
jgi:hypothetical protein